jgi:hypothetical protein
MEYMKRKMNRKHIWSPTSYGQLGLHALYGTLVQVMVG